MGPAGPDQIAPNEAVVGKHLDKGGPMLSPRTFNQNYLENRYKKMEIQEQAAYIEHKDRELMLEQLKQAQSLTQ